MRLKEELVVWFAEKVGEAIVFNFVWILIVFIWIFVVGLVLI